MKRFLGFLLFFILMMPVVSAQNDNKTGAPEQNMMNRITQSETSGSGEPEVKVQEMNTMMEGKMMKNMMCHNGEDCKDQDWGMGGNGRGMGWYGGNWWVHLAWGVFCIAVSLLYLSLGTYIVRKTWDAAGKK